MSRNSLVRRRFLQTTGVGAAAYCLCGDSQSTLQGRLFEPPREDEGIVAYLQRTEGAWDEKRFKKILGAANAFKEGDEIVGVAAEDEQARLQARRLLANTTLREIDLHAVHQDSLFQFAQQAVRTAKLGTLYDQTLGKVVKHLLEVDEASIHQIKEGLSSDVIACLVKLMTDEQLIQLSANLFNPLPHSSIGARGYIGARVQPNSPTDHPEDIRWQVFNAFAFGVGDVLLGTNPVSSNPESVLLIEKTLQEILCVFELTDAMPHCVLAHIDLQAEVEKRQPGSTALWFQSIAGNDQANATFDLTLAKMLDYANQRTGEYGLYFETGQGADFTNGHADGCDMVLWESRKYGFARALSQRVSLAKGSQAWVHVNDVAGFIGPEVFRSREQLVRCCLEDLVMGKLHGLTIGLDICSTLHMDVSLQDLDWCIDQVAPAQPAYLMALPTKIDPMLGYLTTGYHDHVRLREKFGSRINDRMQRFFESLDILGSDGRPTAHFGDPLWVYEAYCRRQGDAASSETLRARGAEQMSEVRRRGVFLSEGYGARPFDMRQELKGEIERIYTDAKECIWREWDSAFVSRLPSVEPLFTQSSNREDYILHPASGEQLSVASQNRLFSLRSTHVAQYDLQIVVSEGLNALALMDDGHLMPLLEIIRKEANEVGKKVAPELLVVHAGRVRCGYRIGEALFGDLPGKRTIVHVIGERPGSGHHTLSVYITSADGQDWNVANRIDHDITRVVSGIATTALTPSHAATEIRRILQG